MKLWGKRTVIWVAAVLVAALAAAGLPLTKAAPIGTGFAAKTICSNVFISGRDAADVFREDVAPVIFPASVRFLQGRSSGQGGHGGYLRFRRGPGGFPGRLRLHPGGGRAGG